MDSLWAPCVLQMKCHTNYRIEYRKFLFDVKTHIKSMVFTVEWLFLFGELSSFSRLSIRIFCAFYLARAFTYVCARVTTTTTTKNRSTKSKTNRNIPMPKFKITESQWEVYRKKCALLPNYDNGQSIHTHTNTISIVRDLNWIDDA